MNYLAHISRIFVSILFILSGLIKLNDPMGFSFKLAEYFSEGVLNLPFFQGFEIYFAIIVIIGEIVLGVMLLFGIFRNITLWSLLAMLVFFGFLTFYSAYFNKVTDCGCFGDAIKLTPWQSFYKDVILLGFVLILFSEKKYIKPLINNDKINFLIPITSTSLCLLSIFYVQNNLPVIDFRPYKIGVNILEGTQGTPSKYNVVYTYEVNGKPTYFKMEELNNLPEGAKYISRKDEILQKGKDPEIHDFTVEKDGTDYTLDYLYADKVVFFVIYDLNKAETEGLKKLNNISKKAKSKGYEVIALTSSPNNVINNFNEKHSFDFDFFFCDGTTLKTIVRATPGVLVLEKGTIKQKLHWKQIEKLQLK